MLRTHAAIDRAHEIVARNLLQPMYQLQRYMRPSRREDVRAFYAGMAFRRRASGWSADRKREYLMLRLRETVRRAWREVPFYRDLYNRIGFDPRDQFGFDDFAQLPVLEREMVRDAGSMMISSAIRGDALRKDSTGGSAGFPTEIWTGPEERGWRESGFEFHMRLIGVPAGASICYLWGHHLDPMGTDRLRDRLHAALGNYRWYECLRLNRDRLVEYHHALQRWRPTCVVAYSTALAALADIVQGLGDAPAYPRKRLVTGAEKLYSNDRVLVEEVYACPVHERYGTRDVGLVGFQLEVDRSHDFVVDWANVFVEPEGPGLRACILVTKLHADAMPMIRYRIGDLGRFSGDSARGHPALVLHEVLGRETYRVWLSEHQWVDGLEFPHLMKDYPVREFQVVQSADMSVVVRVVPLAGFTPRSKDQILELVRKNLGGLDVRLELVGSVARTPSNKRRPVITEYKGSGGA